MPLDSKVSNYPFYPDPPRILYIYIYIIIYLGRAGIAY